MTKKKRISVMRSFLTVCALFFLFLDGCSANMQRYAPPDQDNSSDPVEHSGTETYIADKSSKPYKVLGKWYHPIADARGFRQVGVASWYGEAFHGKSTSSGEIFDMNEISAAHKTLPLGTLVRVRNLENSKTLDIRINDRGPFVRGRVIDLSKTAAKGLGVYGPGTARVEVVVIGAPPRLVAKNGPIQSYVNYYRGNFTIQVGAFSELANAKKFWKEMDKSYKNAHITPYYPHSGKGRLYRVAVGKCSTLERAEKYEEIMRQRGYKDAFMVAE